MIFSEVCIRQTDMQSLWDWQWWLGPQQASNYNTRNGLQTDLTRQLMVASCRLQGALLNTVLVFDFVNVLVDNW